MAFNQLLLTWLFAFLASQRIVSSQTTIAEYKTELSAFATAAADATKDVPRQLKAAEATANGAIAAALPIKIASSTKKVDDIIAAGIKTAKTKAETAKVDISVCLTANTASTNKIKTTLTVLIKNCVGDLKQSLNKFVFNEIASIGKDVAAARAYFEYLGKGCNSDWCRARALLELQQFVESITDNVDYRATQSINAINSMGNGVSRCATDKLKYMERDENSVIRTTIACINNKMGIKY